MIHLLAANTARPVDGDRLFLDLLPWLGVILLLVVVLVITIYLGRRLLKDSDNDSAQPFSLQSLRDLHASGQLSDEEFQRARDAMIGRIKTESTDADEGPAKRRDGEDETGEGDAARKDKPQDSATSGDGEPHDGEAEDPADHGEGRPGHADNNDEGKPKNDPPG